MTVYCWGNNDHGRLGNTTATEYSVPVAGRILTQTGLPADTRPKLAAPTRGGSPMDYNIAYGENTICLHQIWSSREAKRGIPIRPRYSVSPSYSGSGTAVIRYAGAKTYPLDQTPT
jgi:hypothetical protein